jgi:hypothetical protein
MVIGIMGFFLIVEGICLVALANTLAKYIGVIQEQGRHLTAINALDRVRARQINMLRERTGERIDHYHIRRI